MLDRYSTVYSSRANFLNQKGRSPKLNKIIYLKKQRWFSTLVKLLISNQLVIFPNNEK